MCKVCERPLRGTSLDDSGYCSFRCQAIHRNERMEMVKINGITCRHCGCVFIPKSLSKTYFCSKDCRSLWSRQQYKISSSNTYRGVGLSTGTVGSISELLVSTDLLVRGFQVFRSMSPNSCCDLVIIGSKTGKAVKVEVTSGAFRKDGEITYPKKDDSYKHDTLAVVLPDRSITYLPALETFDAL